MLQRLALATETLNQRAESSANKFCYSLRVNPQPLYAGLRSNSTMAWKSLDFTALRCGARVM